MRVGVRHVTRYFIGRLLDSRAVPNRERAAPQASVRTAPAPARPVRWAASARARVPLRPRQALPIPVEAPEPAPPARAREHGVLPALAMGRAVLQERVRERAALPVPV